MRKVRILASIHYFTEAFIINSPSIVNLHGKMTNKSSKTLAKNYGSVNKTSKSEWFRKSIYEVQNHHIDEEDPETSSYKFGL